MLTQERYDRILTLLIEKKSITVNELVEALDTSESTIRRDLNNLDKKNYLKKVHGGAVLVENDFSNIEYNVIEKARVNTFEKKKIASYAASLIKKDDFVFIDAGTTTDYMVDYITEKGAHYVTNGIIHGKKLAARGFDCIIIGGKIKSVTEAIVGIEAVSNIKRFNFTKGFFGTNALNNVSGYSTPDIEEALVKEEAIKHSKKAYVLVDDSKYNKTSSITFGELQDATIITNKDVGQYNRYTKVIEVIRDDI